MKTRFLKSALVLTLICILVFSLTGCDNLDYREAVELYNAGNYEDAAKIFAQLEDYEDSAQLETRCYYWLAVKAMEYSRFDAALEQFQALGDYEDSLARITECKYQLALTAFDSGDLDTAESTFLEAPDYRQASEYLRRIYWQRLHTAITESGAENEDSFTLLAEDPNALVAITAKCAEPDQLILSVSQTKDMGYVFSDSLAITLVRDSTSASFAAESGFTMDFKGGQIGSQQTGSGAVDVATVTGETVLTLNAFEITVTDNLGKTTTSTDPADSLMNEAMAENLKILLDTAPDILTDADIAITLRDIGFSATE